ncbi:thrombospondin type-1 domain-containing protein 4-like [Artemia franciscana]
MVSARGPLSDSMDIMLFTQNLNTGIKYEYMVAIPPDFNSGRPSGRNRDLDLLPVRQPFDNTVKITGLGSGGSLQQNFGIQPEIFPTQVSIRDSRVSQGPVQRNRNKELRRHRQRIPSDDPSVLQRKHHPIRHRSRNRGFVWKHIGVGDCSATCGGGIQSPIYGCFRESNGQQVPDHRCKALEKPVIESIRCNVQPCTPEWTASEWTSCSTACGEGTQTREVACKQRLSPTIFITVPETSCISPPPQAVRSCFSSACKRWIAAPWGNCSTDCGRGYRHRLIQCLDGVGEVIPDENCVETEKPIGREPCDMGSCLTNTWFVTEWTGKCLDECGTGTQTRDVICLGDEGACDNSQKPNSRQRCPASKECSGKWFTGPWSQCSASCNEGFQTREVVCMAFMRGQYKMALDMQCSSKTKPESKQICNQGPCEPQWYSTLWSECSASCSIGVQRRELKCLDPNHQPSLDCKEDLKPAQRQSCNQHDCSSISNAVSTEAPDIDSSENQSAHSSSSEIVREKPRKKRPNVTKNDVLNEDPNIDGIPQGLCTDKFRNCHLVVQARLCKYKYYKTSCCASCHKTRS